VATHIFTHYRKLGGVESMLRRHVGADRAAGRQPGIVGLFEPQEAERSAEAAEAALQAIGLTGGSSPWSARRRWRRRLPAGLGNTVVYHNAWGASFLAEFDGASRRLALLHSHWPGVEAVLSAQMGLFDGWMTVSEPLRRLVQARLPDFPDDRITVLPVPVTLPGDAPGPKPPLRERPVVLGFCGRVVRAQKRVDRLPPLAGRLQAAGIRHDWEILGEGPELPALRAALGGQARFHGRITGDDYWRTLDHCDLLVFVSDYEGLPISLIEAFARGTLAVFPAIGSGGDDYVTRLAPELIYQPGDLEGAAQAIRWFLSLSEPARARLREQALALAATHAGKAYETAFDTFTVRIGSLPRLSAAGPAARRPHRGWWLPFALLNRLPPTSGWRRGLV